MQNTPAVIALRSDIESGGHRDAAALRDKVFAVVDELRAAGWPPERVIVAVKRIADEAGVRPSQRVLSKSAEIDGNDALLVHMVQWCIVRYFRQD